jgi:putative FmdB family regulatory protein
MPTYDYVCDACGNEFERVQRITEKPLKKCPKCGRLKARRMIGGGGFILKGGGWESDLYSGPSNRAKTEAKSNGSESSGDSKSSKPESKPAAKPESKPASKADA